jgi:ABC-type lipoprotein export system ATPase subunit
MGLVLQQIRKVFGQTVVLHDINVEIAAGEFVSLIGKSGSGKSTLLYIASSLDNPTSGRVVIDGVPLDQLNKKELHHFRNTQMGFVFQFHYLLPELTVLENILMPAQKYGCTQSHRDHAKFLLSEFGILDKQNYFPKQLSGGQQQRVAIARALVMKPTYLFADEPTGNLDSQNGNSVMSLLKQFNSTYNMTLLLVTHDNEFAEMARRKVVLVDGKVA